MLVSSLVVIIKRLRISKQSKSLLCGCVGEDILVLLLLVGTAGVILNNAPDFSIRRKGLFRDLWPFLNDLLIQVDYSTKLGEGSAPFEHFYNTIFPHIENTLGERRDFNFSFTRVFKGHFSYRWV